MNKQLFLAPMLLQINSSVTLHAFMYFLEGMFSTPKLTCDPNL